MEASLLPSRAIRDLCRQAVVAVVKTSDAACAALRKEFAIPYLNSWVVVLDGKGETLAGWLGDAAGAGCKKSSVGQFPRNVVRLVRKSLERTETVEELERRWMARPHDAGLFEGLAGRLVGMHAYGRLRRLCQDAAANPAFSEPQRDGFRIRSFVARASDPAERLSTRRARTAFVREGEKLLAQLAGHPRAGDLVGALFSRGYAHCFDVPARSAAAVARLERACREARDAAPLKQRIGELAEMREGWTSATRQALERVGDSSGKKFFAAMLGDARAAIDLFSRPPYSRRPDCREWLREAKRKAETRRGRTNAR